MKIDYSDYYIEEVQQVNTCGEVSNSIFYIRVAIYNWFGKKKYRRLRLVEKKQYSSPIYREVYKYKKEDIIDYYRKLVVGQQIKIHKDKIC